MNNNTASITSNVWSFCNQLLGYGIIWSNTPTVNVCIVNLSGKVVYSTKELMNEKVLHSVCYIGYYRCPKRVSGCGNDQFGFGLERCFGQCNSSPWRVRDQGRQHFLLVRGKPLDKRCIASGHVLFIHGPQKLDLREDWHYPCSPT